MLPARLHRRRRLLVPLRPPLPPIGLAGGRRGKRHWGHVPVALLPHPPCLGTHPRLHLLTLLQQLHRRQDQCQQPHPPLSTPLRPLLSLLLTPKRCSTSCATSRPSSCACPPARLSALVLPSPPLPLAPPPLILRCTRGKRRGSEGRLRRVRGAAAMSGHRSHLLRGPVTVPVTECPCHPAARGSVGMAATPLGDRTAAPCQCPPRSRLLKLLPQLVPLSPLALRLGDHPLAPA